MPNAITGINEHLIDYLNESIRRANSIRLIVAFLMESGAKLLSKELAEAVQRGVPVKILTGRYLDVTEPSALYYLKDKLGDGVEVKFVKDNIRSFHPKAYIFDFEEDSEIYVGSSNISHTALGSGVELQVEKELGSGRLSEVL
jgi:HKD family nuclease